MDINPALKKLLSDKQKPDSHLHSPNHVLADELSKKLGEPRRFGFYLKLAERYDHGFLRRIAGTVAEGGAKRPGALFAFLVKKQAEEAKQGKQEIEK